MIILRKTLLCCLLLICADALAHDDASLETRIKAAFLFKFCNYIQWPNHAFENAKSPLVIAIADSDILAEELQQVVRGRRVGERPLTVRKMKPGDELAGVHVLFVGSSVPWHSIFSAEVDLPVLTVTDTSSDAAQSIINFVIVDNRVRFDIFQNRAEKAGLKLSSLLLSVARHVQTTSGNVL